MIWQTFALFLLLFSLSVCDIRTRRLPDVLTLPLIGFGLLGTWFVDTGAVGLHLAGAIGGFGSFFALSFIYRQIRNQNGLGLGDAKLLAAVGAWLGPLYLAPVVFVGASLALVYVIAWRVAGTELNLTSIVPFGPFLSAAFFLFWCVTMLGVWSP